MKYFLIGKENHFENHYKDVEDKFKSIEEEANKIEEYNKELEQAKLSEEQTQAKFKALNDKSDAFQVTMTEANEFFTVIKKEMDKVLTLVIIPYVIDVKEN